LPRLFRTLLSLLALSIFATGCAEPRSTRMTAGDFDHMGAEMAASLARSDALRNRTAASPPWVVSIDKVQNLSSDVMTESEQWMIIARLRGSLPIQALRTQRSITFVMPPERVEALRRDPNLGAGVGDFGPDLGADRRPTHQLNATFRSLARVNPTGTGSEDYYYCEFQMLDLATGQPVWIDKVEYKRLAKGHIWD
jgi:hypothetical protein